MYYENFEKLCKRDGVNPSKISKATGISTATLTSWKQGKYTPKQDKLQLIADYFKVSVDYLMTGKMGTIIETAKTDVMLSNMDNRLKEYALKMSELSKEKQDLVLKMIDELGK